MAIEWNRIGWRRFVATPAGGLAVGMLAAALAATPGAHAWADDAPDATLPDSWASQLSWRSIGPANMSGRITDLTVYEADPSTWWAATASGGLLKTTNNGVTFEHQFDREATVSIGAVAVAQSDPEVIYVGTGEANPRNSVSWGNGVYKSTDGGDTWTHLGLDDSFQTGQILVHPDDADTVYVGALGRLWGPNEERGLYKSVDGGENWDRILYVDDQTGVIDLIMHPEDPDTLLVATYERQRDGFDTNDPAKKFGPGAGLWKTTDGGKTFDRITEGLPTSNLGRIGLDWSRSNPDLVYAVVESEKIGQEPEDVAYFGVRGESVEVGARLTEITEGGPAAAAELQAGDIVVEIGEHVVHDYQSMLGVLRRFKAGETARVKVSRDRKTVEVDVTFDRRPEAEEDQPQRGPFQTRLGGQPENIQDEQGEDGFEFGGVFKSEDAGDSWTRVNSVNPRPMYYSQIRIDPSDPNYIYVLGTSLYKSSDGGATFSGDGHRGKNGSVHVDHHAMWINPDDGRHIILGNDGGIYMTHDRMENWDHYNHVAIGQFYHVTVGPRENYWVYGGLQDNGSWGGPTRTYTGGTRNQDWVRIGGGDGFICRVDPADPEQIYYESQNGGLGRTNLRTDESRFLRPRPPRGERYRFNWRTPFILSHHNPKIYYTAGNKVFRSLFKGDDLKAISPEITPTDRGSATALTESPRNADLLYVGTDDGGLWMTEDGGVTWVDLFELGGPVGEPASGDEEKIAAARLQTTNDPNGERRRGGRGGGMLARADANGDGKLQRSELPDRMQAMFDRIDANKDGAIDQDELNAMRRNRGQRGGGGGDDPPSVQQVLSHVDDETADDGPSSIERVLMRVLRKADKDGDGRIARSDVPAHMHKMFDRVDADGDGEITEDEMKAFGARIVEKGRDTDDAAAAERAAGEQAVGEQAAENQQVTGQDADAAGDESDATSDDAVTGVWNAASGGGEMGPSRPFTLRLKLEDENKVTGELSSEIGEGPVRNGRFDAASGRLTFDYARDEIEFSVVGTITGDAMEGEIVVQGGQFTLPFTATRGEIAADEPEAPAGPGVSELLPGRRWVSSLEASRHETDRVYATFDGHRSDDDAPHAFVSDDRGRSWRSLTTNLPDSAGSVRVLREDLVNPDVLYLGCEFGAWVSIDRGETWTRLGDLPTVSVHEIAQHPTRNEIVAGTHGRSLWVLDVAAVRQMSAESVASKATLYRPNTAYHWRNSRGRGDTLRRFIAGNAPEGAEVFYSLGEGVRNVTLEVLSMSGEVLHTFDDAESSPGLHRHRWSLREAPPQNQQQRRRFRRGPRVEPGVYQVRLTADDMTVTKSFRVKGDPDHPEMILWGETFDENLEQIELIEGDEEGGDFEFDESRDS